MKINSDTPEGKTLRGTYNIKGLPTVLLLDAQGKEIDRILGYEGREEFAGEYLGFLYGVGTLSDLLARVGETPDGPAAQRIAGKFLGRSDGASALQWIAKARAAKGEVPADFGKRLDLMEAQSLVLTEPEKGRAALKALASDPKAGDIGEEAFSDLSRYLKKKNLDADLVALYDIRMAFLGDSTEFLNSYAWTFAERGIALPKALEAAKKAVALSKEDPGILDTLAEVYFKMGKRDLAVQTIEKAIAAKPDDTYYQEQKAKFLKDEPAKK